MLAQLLLRIGLALVFLGMGVDKFINPTAWAAELPILAPYLSIIAGIQIATAILFLTRWYRIAALLSAVMLGGAVFLLGVTMVALRDVGLFFASLALLLPWKHHLTPRHIVHEYQSLFYPKKSKKH